MVQVVQDQPKATRNQSSGSRADGLLQLRAVLRRLAGLGIHTGQMGDEKAIRNSQQPNTRAPVGCRGKKIPFPSCWTKQML